MYIVTPFVTLANVAVLVTEEKLTSYSRCKNEPYFAETHVTNFETVFVEEQIIRNEEVATIFSTFAVTESVNSNHS